jgi:AcrR family transcriptional regulator
MFEKFESLPEEKKKRILNACIKEFAINNYDKASTNNIVANAEISKGILFHYFGNKKNLYLYVFEYAVTFLLQKMQQKLPNPSTDIFEMIIQYGNIKLEVSIEEPYLYSIIYDSYFNAPKILKNAITKKYQHLYENQYEKIFNTVDKSKFKNDVDPIKAIKLIIYFLEGYYNSYINIMKEKSLEEVIDIVKKAEKESIEYFEFLKKLLYKE